MEKLARHYEPDGTSESPEQTYDSRKGWRMDVILKRTGCKMPGVSKVVMFGHTHEGLAELTCYCKDAGGNYILSSTRTAPKLIFMAHVSLFEPGTTNPLNLNRDLIPDDPVFIHERSEA